MSDTPDKPGPERGDPSWVAPALTRESQTRAVGKTQVFFGPPLARLAAGQKNTLEISGRLNRTAERYLEILAEQRKIPLTPVERECVVHVCGVGFMGPDEIRELPDDVAYSTVEAEGLDKQALAEKLALASFVERVALIEELGL